MYLEITDATYIVLMLLFTIIVIFLSVIFVKSIGKEKKRHREEKEISIEGLLSKSAIKSQVSSYLSRISSDSSFSLLMLEIQDYDDIIDAFGAKEAERALEKAIYRVIHQLPKRVQIASFGGTRFMLFLKSEYDRFFSIDLAKKIITSVNRPIKIYRETSINFTSNVGICFYPKHGRKFKQLMNSLDIALYNAIKAGENRHVVYSQNMKTEFSDNIEYHFEIKEAIEKKEFIMEYQPIIDIEKNEIYGFEGFVRWNHPKHGILSPVQFLNIMEQSGDINWIGVWGLETIIDLNYKLNREFPGKELMFTINLSPRQLVDDKIADNFGRLIKRYKMPASKISLEIAEYSTYEKNSVVRNNIARLKRLGFKIAINGFGLDYSTLSEIESMPIDIIRLDKQFFDKDKESYMKDKLTTLIVDFANKHNKTVIAEYIETYDMLEMIIELGIKIVQGHIFSKSLAQDELANFIRKRLWENKELNEDSVVEETLKVEPEKKTAKEKKFRDSQAIDDLIQKNIEVKKQDLTESKEPIIEEIKEPEPVIEPEKVKEELTTPIIEEAEEQVEEEKIEEVREQETIIDFDEIDFM